MMLYSANNKRLIPALRLSERKIVKRKFKEELGWKQPITEVLDLRVTAQPIIPEKPFKVISRMQWYIRFPANNVLFSNFGADAALTNGIQLRYNEINLLDETIKDLSDIPKYCYDFTLLQDATATTKLNMAISRWSWFKWGLEGLDLRNERRFEVVVQDNLSASLNTQIHLTLEGWGY